jgi:hypothetical protein
MPGGRDGFLLHELQAEAVALADRGVARAILLSEAKRRRQRPHARRVVLRVARVGVDLGPAGELEAGALDQLNRSSSTAEVAPSAHGLVTPGGMK